MATGTQIWVPVFFGALLGKVLRENIWQFQLKSVILQRDYLLKSVVFTCLFILKSVVFGPQTTPRRFF